MCHTSKFAAKNGLLKESSIFIKKLKSVCFFLAFCCCQNIEKNRFLSKKSNVCISEQRRTASKPLFEQNGLPSQILQIIVLQWRRVKNLSYTTINYWIQNQSTNIKFLTIQFHLIILTAYESLNLKYIRQEDKNRVYIDYQ